MNKKEFNYFNEVKHVPLRIFNRTAMFYNLKEDFGSAVAEDYVSQLSAPQKLQIVLMIEAIKKEGLDNIRKIVTEGVEFDDKDYVYG